MEPVCNSEYLRFIVREQTICFLPKDYLFISLCIIIFRNLSFYLKSNKLGLKIFVSS